MGSPNGRDAGQGAGFATVDSTLTFANTLATYITFAPFLFLDPLVPYSSGKVLSSLI